MAVIITRAQLAKIFPRPSAQAHAAIWDSYADMLTSDDAANLIAKAGITTQTIFKQFCAMIDVECGGLTIIQESGAYRASTILAVFGAGHHSAAVTAKEAAQIASLPVYADGSGPRCDALFERVYGLGNPHMAKMLGNTQPGDGPKFRGLGINQLTGRDAHTKMATAIGCSLDDLKLPLNLLKIALLEWTQKNCNKYAATGDYVSIRKLINGGSLSVPVSHLNGLPEVSAFLRKSDSRFAGIIYDAPDPTISVAQAQPAPDVVKSDVPAAAVPQLDLANATKKAGIVVTATSAIGDVGETLGQTVGLLQPIKSNITALKELLPSAPVLVALMIVGIILFIIGRYLEELINDWLRNSGMAQPA